LFAVTVFASAALVFMVEPMVAKLVLPLLGGSSSVWNTSLAFFQTALLAGYGYAHALQRLRSIRGQAVAHGVALVAAALVLPLHINQLFGPPSSVHPNLWLLGVLTVSIGPPFAVLSATAPLVQTWYARTFASEDDGEPYVLYAASNFGSLLALLAYPLVVEPTLTVPVQTGGWSAGYAVFILLMASLAFLAVRATHVPSAAASQAARADVPAVRWRDRLGWIALAAIPSSLMLGVTAHITTDVASAPFLWVAPLALYLLTFIIAFQAKPAIPPDVTLVLQAATVAICVGLLPFGTVNLLLQLTVHLSAFFLTALMCHQRLVARRPDPARLTEFYLWMSVGGVIGGGFNAFLAPMIFNNVWEYPLVLVLSCLARPWGDWKVEPAVWVMLFLGVGASLAGVAVNSFVGPHAAGQAVFAGMTRHDVLDLTLKLCLATAMVAAFMVRTRALLFFGVIAVLCMAAYDAAERAPTTYAWRSFFGVLTQSQTTVAGIGVVKMLAHGTTLHGAQATDLRWRCRPMVYYAAPTPIGQVFRALEKEKPAIRVGAVGLGTGSVAAYVRATDRLTFFEIDPLVIRISTDPAHFSYTTRCAKGPIDYVVGDARLTVAKQPAEAFDILLIDAFSSDAVPAHLLTVEAVRNYLTHLKPDGVLILHLSNRNLDLDGPAQAVAKAAGGVGRIQKFRPVGAERIDWASPEDAVIIGRSQAALDRFAKDPRWRPLDPGKVRPWTDNYTNLFGALWRRMKEKFSLGPPEP
jgi:SAM-dependent methyltransferase